MNPPPLHRLFFALRPPPALAESVAGFAAALQARLGEPPRQRVAMERLHVTLQFLGDHAELPEDLAAAAGRAAQGLAWPAFDIAFDRVETFRGAPGRLPCVLRGDAAALAGAVALHAGLDAALRRQGVVAAGRFTPHMTLFYSGQAVASEPIAPVAWTADTLLLVHSLIGRGEHRVLGRWPLAQSRP